MKRKTIDRGEGQSARVCSLEHEHVPFARTLRRAEWQERPWRVALVERDGVAARVEKEVQRTGDLAADRGDRLADVDGGAPWLSFVLAEVGWNDDVVPQLNTVAAVIEHSDVSPV